MTLQRASIVEGDKVQKKEAKQPASAIAGSAFCVMKKPEMPGQLYFWTRSGWVGEVPADQAALRVAFDDVCSVLRARFQEKAPNKFEEEFNRLLQLAHAAFSGEYAQVTEGTGSLEAYKAELVLREGPAIKDEYLKELAISALIASLVLVLAGVALRIAYHYGEQTGFIQTIPTEHQRVLASSVRWDDRFSLMHFALLLASTMWGIWLSFAVRSMNFQFEQLQHAEADLMRPWSRLLTFGILAFILALFFQMQILVISVGGVSTSQISENALVAVFVGLGLGFTDKALPSEVRRRFEEFFQNAKKPNSLPNTGP